MRRGRALHGFYASLRLTVGSRAPRVRSPSKSGINSRSIGDSMLTPASPTMTRFGETGTFGGVLHSALFRLFSGWRYGCHIALAPCRERRTLGSLPLLIIYAICLGAVDSPIRE